MDKTRFYLTESLSTKERNKRENKSVLATIITLIGYLIIVSGFILGSIMAFINNGIDNFILVLVYISSLIFGIIIIGFGKIIYLLQEINNHLQE